MAQQTINLGTIADDGTGDTLRVGGDKINDNFTELYAADAALGTAAPLDIDTDGTLAADSDSLIATQKAVKLYVDTEVAAAGGITELDDVPDVNAPTPTNGDVLTWDSTPGEWVAQALPGAGSFVLDDATDVDTTGQTTGDVLTYDGADWVPQAPSGGAAWALAGTGQTATGVYDQAVDGTKATVDFVGLSAANEILIIARDVTLSSSGSRVVQVSVDNGSSFYSTSGDYVSIDNAGVAANTTAVVVHSTSTTAARSFTAHIRNTKGAAKAIDSRNNSYSQTLFVASASDINALRFLGTAGSINGGTIRIYAR